MGLSTFIKRRIILNHLAKKKVKEPFDAMASETFELPQGSDVHINNSHFFTAADMEGNNLSIRLGMRNGTDYEVFILWRHDGRFYTHACDKYPSHDCPIKFSMLECAKKWQIDYSGPLRDDKTGELIDSIISVVFDASLPIYDFVYHADRFNGMADSIAREKWNKKFFEEVGKNDQRHYEQTGRIAGYVTTGDLTTEVDMPCVRDHSFGRREWDMMNDHLWCLGITEKGEAICFSIVNYPMMKRIFSGYTNIGSDCNRTLRDYEVVKYDVAEGLGGDTLQYHCYFPEGKPVNVTIHRENNVTCPLGDGKYIFQEGLGEFEIDGIKARGTIEYGFNQNPARWEGFSKL